MEHTVIQYGFHNRIFIVVVGEEVTKVKGGGMRGIWVYVVKFTKNQK